MRYHYNKPKIFNSVCGQTYCCDHPLYNRCTLYLIDGVGLAVIQQRFKRISKSTYWTEIDPWLVDDIFNQSRFLELFKERASSPVDDLYPTMSVRQIMWALKMKPLKKEPWETVFDRKYI